MSCVLLVCVFYLSSILAGRLHMGHLLFWDGKASAHVMHLAMHVWTSNQSITITVSGVIQQKVTLLTLVSYSYIQLFLLLTCTCVDTGTQPLLSHPWGKWRTPRSPCPEPRENGAGLHCRDCPPLQYDANTYSIISMQTSRADIEDICKLNTYLW
jgi:hypothetical protein